jgi:hypothetical protein
MASTALIGARLHRSLTEALTEAKAKADPTRLQYLEANYGAGVSLPNLKDPGPTMTLLAELVAAQGATIAAQAVRIAALESPAAPATATATKKRAS